MNNRPPTHPTNQRPILSSKRKLRNRWTDGHGHVTRSRFTHYCGAYGHTKDVETPEIERSVSLSIFDCWDLVTTQVFVTPDKIRRPITLNAENLIPIEELGTINIGDNTLTCHGQSKKIEGFIIQDIIVTAQYRVLVSKTKIQNSRQDD